MSSAKGKAGHLAFMGELALRGYNVAIPEIDSGDDVFAFNEQTGQLMRVQVKTATCDTPTTDSAGLATYIFTFNIKIEAILTPRTPDIHFAFVMRAKDRWFFATMLRAALETYYDLESAFGVQLRDDATHATLKFKLTPTTQALIGPNETDISKHLGTWREWPVVGAQI